MQEGRASWRHAFERLVAVNPLPATMGHVCYAACESACLRDRLDEGLAIRSLERALGRAALDEAWPLPSPGPPTGHRVVVAGSGPAGLAAAHALRQAGHEVILAEARTGAGGMLRYAIPESRLPRDVLDAEVARLLECGVDLQLRTVVREPMRTLEGADALIYCAGAANVLAIVDGAVLWNQPAHERGATAVRNVAIALGNGRRAADAVSECFGCSPQPADAEETRAAVFTDLNRWYYPQQSRLLPASAAGRSPRDQMGRNTGVAVSEARRCLSCGRCLGCDNCYGMCPDNAVIKLDGTCSYAIDLDHCKGCGLCAEECPSGAIEMVPEEL